MNTRTQLIIFTSCILTLSGCSLLNPKTDVSVEEKKEKDAEEIDTSDWKTYTNEEYKFSFRYPGEWGDPSLDFKKESPFDKGQMVKVFFSNNPDLWTVFFSDDYELGVGEGTPIFFNPAFDTQATPSYLKESLENFGIDVTESTAITISDREGIKVIGNRGYTMYRVGLSYLFPDFLRESPVSNLSLFWLIGDESEQPYSDKEVVNRVKSQDAQKIDYLLLVFLSTFQ